LIRFLSRFSKKRLINARHGLRRQWRVAFFLMIGMGAAALFGQSIMNKTIVGNVFIFECQVKAPTDTVGNRLGAIDSLAKIMGCACRRGASASFDRVGDAALMAMPSSRKGGEFGMVQLTALRAGSEMRFIYQSMSGGLFFQDTYVFFRASESATKLRFTRRCLPEEAFSPEQISEQKTLMEGNLFRLEKMMEAR